MASLKSTFSVRKSGRLLSLSKKEKAAVTGGTGKDENEKKNGDLPTENQSVSGKKVDSSEKTRSVMRSIRRVFSGRRSQSQSENESESNSNNNHAVIANNNSRTNLSPKSFSPVKGACGGGSPYLTVNNATYSPSSSTSFDASPLSRTPDRSMIRPVASPGDIARVSRRLLSPSKRKSDEENENVECSPSPPKLSCGSSTPSLSPPRSNIREQVTPKSTRRHNVSLSRTATSTPRRLFESNDDEKDVKSSPQKLVLQLFKSPSPRHTNGARIYQSTKRCLHTSKPDRLIGRDKEEAEIEEFITKRLDEETSGSLYISGAPGTGKTAVVNHVVARLQSQCDSLLTASINCMTLKDSNSVFSALYLQLTGKVVKGKDSMKALEKFFSSSKKSTVLVLDEIDQLDSKHHEVLYRIFEWPVLKGSRLILLGIANALDLTDRVLPRLQASVSCRPDLMNFAPYSSSQITDILKHRLEKDAIVEPSAINFCARKVSAVAGDIRKALDVCRRAVELVETDARDQNVLKPTDCNSPTKRNQVPEVKRVTITHISRVMSDVYGSSVTSANSSENDVPLQQKLAVCSLLVMVKRGKVKEVLLGKLHEMYTKTCRSQQMSPVDQSEFHSICSLLEARGIVAMKKAKDTRSIKVSLKLDEQELEQTLKDKTLMAKILNDGLKGV